MKKALAFLLVLIFCLSFSGVALAISQDLKVTDGDGNPIDWIQFKLHPTYGLVQRNSDHISNDIAREVDTVYVIPIYNDYLKDQLYAAAQEAYPGATVNELGRINMSGWDTQDGYTYIFDYFGPFTAQVDNADVHNGDKVVMFIINEEGPVQQVKASCVKDGTFSFSDLKPGGMEADIVYVILHKEK